MTRSGAAQTDPVLPGYLMALVAMLLVAVAHLISIWKANPNARLFRILRATLLIVGGLILFKGAMDVMSIFANLAMSSGASPDDLFLNLSEVKPAFQAGFVVLVISAVFAALAVGGSEAGVGGNATKWAETIGWLVAIAILMSLIAPFSTLDGLLGLASSGAADPAALAQQFSIILKGEQLGMAMLVLLGIVGLVFALKAKRSVVK